MMLHLESQWYFDVFPWRPFLDLRGEVYVAVYGTYRKSFIHPVIIQNGRAEVQSLLNLFSRLPHSSGTLVRSGLRVQWTDSSISWRADYIHLFSYHTDRTTERSMSISQIMTEQAQAEAVLIFKNLMTLHFCSALVSYHCYPCLISLWLIFVMESVHE